MKKNTIILSSVVVVLIIVLIVILLFAFRGKEIVYEEGVSNVATTSFTKSMGKEILKVMFPTEKTTTETVTFLTVYEKLVKGDIDVIFALKPTREMIEYSKDTLTETEMIPVAKDALIVMNNRYNPVKNITKEQFEKIYSGSITNWKELNGDEIEIIPYLTTAREDSYFALNEIMNGSTIVTPKLTLRNPSLTNILKAIGEYEDTADSAIGYGLFYDFDTITENRNINILSVNGVKPTVESIKTEEYPLMVNVYAIIRKDSAENSRARRLVNFILSEEGQNILEKNGYFKIEG